MYEMGLSPRCIRAPLALLLRQGIGCAILLALLWTPATAEEAKISFDIPAGGAIETLKTFSTQSNARLLYSVEAVSHVRTKLVKGIYMPREALAIMLAGTDLVANQNPRDGAFAVSRLGPSNSQPPQKKK